ncbi:MAG TPA: alpha/beta hydrolase-fold protein [Polyangia bacterium]|jgi:enterochelin esterase family protein|nr:alpha/beta hydrolase-fold protein [Polyangia bacterium]
MAAFHRGCIPVLGTLVICACAGSSPKTGVSGGAGAGGQTATAGAAGAIAGDAGGAAGARGALDAGTAGAIGGTAGASPVDGAAGAAGPSTDGPTFPIGDPGTDGDGDLTISPPYTTQPDLTDQGNPKGKSFHFTMSSAQSQIFKGDDTTLLPANQHTFTRGVDVYVPALYEDGTPAPLLVIQDGPGELGLVKNALDNLTISKDATRKLPVFVVVAIANGGGDSKGSERGLEYDTMSDRYARFVQTEVLPAVVADANVKAAFPRLTFTDDPEGKATLGCSSGGAAALTMGWFRPDLFHRVITYSGTFVAQQNDTAPEQAMYPDGAWDYHSNLDLIGKTPRKDLRVFLNCNQMDNGATAPASGEHNWVIANQRTAAALEAQDYHYRFIYAMQAGHCDGNVQNATLADTLVWTWRGFPAP